MQCNAMQRNAMQCNAMQCNAMQCNAMQCNAKYCLGSFYRKKKKNTKNQRILVRHLLRIRLRSSSLR